MQGSLREHKTNLIGVMQGRLSPAIENKIQAFPADTWQTEFQKAQRLGLDFIEWTLDQSMLYENPLLTPVGLDKIQNLIKMSGVDVLSVTGDCFMQLPVHEDDNHVFRFERILGGMAEISGCDTLVVPLVDAASISDEKTEEIIRAKFHDIEYLLEKHSITIAIESDYEPERLVRFIKSLDSQYFGVTFDMGNSASLGWDPAVELTTLQKVIRHVHIKDRCFGGGTVSLGSGDTDFTTIFSHRTMKKYSGKMTLQVARTFDHICPEESIRLAQSALNSYFKSVEKDS